MNNLSLYEKVKNNFLLSVPKKKSTKIYNPDDIIELGNQLENIDSHIKAITINKLKFISKQIKHLQQEAINTVNEAKKNISLTHAKCNFKKIKGNTYHLYKKNNEYFFSMLSPKDWNNNPPNEYINSYIFEGDMSWRAIDEVEEEIDMNLLGLNKNNLLQD